MMAASRVVFLITVLSTYLDMLSMAAEIQRFTFTLTGKLECQKDTPDTTADVILFSRGKGATFMGRGIANENGEINVVGYVMMITKPEIKIEIFTQCDLSNKLKGKSYRKITLVPPKDQESYELNMRLDAYIENGEQAKDSH